MKDTTKIGLPFICVTITLIGLTWWFGTLSVATTQQSSPTTQWPNYGHQSNWQTRLPIGPDSAFSIDWDVEVGQGRSQVVGVDNDLYVATGSSQKNGEQMELKTRYVCLDLSSGEEKWSFEQSSRMLKGQENFSGATSAPQSTPVISGRYLVSVNFSGQLTCLDRSDGKPVWQTDLVTDLNAAPVQFGFSSSPMVDRGQPNRVYVTAAGQLGGFYCLNLEDGAVVWKADCETFSYATPVLASFGGVKQWILMTENELLGVAHEDGRRLWRHELAETGLTNVPTPLCFDESTLIISGQGCKGTRCLSVTKSDSDWQISERWFQPQLQFFYGNWLRWNDRVVVGCTDKYLAALDISDGSLLGRWRGYGDGNVTIDAKGEQLLLLDGKGNLNVLSGDAQSDSSTSGFLANRKFKIVEARCWTPISVINQRLLIRGENRLVCVALNSTKQGESLENVLAATKKLEFSEPMSQSNLPNPVEQIFAAFETEGQAAALKLYSELRSQQQLNVQSRIELATAAKAQGLSDVARKMIADAKEDFPESKEMDAAAKRIFEDKSPLIPGPSDP